MSVEVEVLRQLHGAFPVRSVQVALAKLGLKATMPLRVVHSGLQKVATLVDAVEAEGAGSAQEILAACERFARHKGQWLKVAGLDKAEILEMGLEGRRLQPSEVALEFGVFIGYTAIRLGSALKTAAKVISLEVSPIHVCVARHLLDLGALGHVCEVKPGQAKDALALLAEEFGSGSAGFCFMDHRGTIFHQDFNLLQRHDLFAENARFIADNTLNPGAPIFLWERFQEGKTTCFSITEFLAEHEDWSSVSDRSS